MKPIHLLYLSVLIFFASCGGANEQEDDFFSDYRDAYEAYMSGEKSVEETIPAIEKFVDDHPKEEVGHLFLAHLRSWQNDWPAAEAAYRDALALNSKSTDGLLGIGYIHLNRRSYDSVDIYMDKVLEVNAKNSYAFANLAVSSLMQGDTALALQHMESSLEFEETGYNTALSVLLWQAVGQMDDRIKAQSETANTLNAAFMTKPGLLLKHGKNLPSWLGE
jgi:Tfp pilus assembly protein PilF